ncbi:MAG: hypothetical protein OXU19_09160, partial [bacterium]|nr:hypothetical protein [bacterium]
MPATAIVPTPGGTISTNPCYTRGAPVGAKIRILNNNFLSFLQQLDEKAPPFFPQCHKVPEKATMATLHLTQHRVDTLKPRKRS